MADNTAGKQPAHLNPDLQFKPGQSGNPKGRPLGARSKLGEAFLEAMQQDFEANGIAAIVEVRETKPDQYLKVIASILPKELNVNVNEVDSLTDDELIERIRAFDAAIRPYLALEGATEGESGAPPASTH